MPVTWLVCVLGLSRESRELVCQDSKDCQVFLEFLVHLGRRETSEDQAFPGSTEILAPQAFRESEVTSYRQI